MRDVIIIGSGIAGCCAASSLSRYDLDVLVVDAGHDVAAATTHTNSGIIHGGFDPLPGTVKAHYNLRGMRMYAELADRLGFRYERTGSLVISFTPGSQPGLRTLLDRGEKNGLTDLRIASGEEARELEPELSEDVTAALVCDESGIVDPFGACVAFAEHAAVNGVEFVFDARVRGIELVGSDGHTHYVVTFADDTRIEARTIVNAAGVHADIVEGMVGPASFSITPVSGEYLLYDRGYGNLFTRTIFQEPTQVGKGVLVTPTVEGNLLIGPDAVVKQDREDTSTRAEGLAEIASRAALTWPGLSREGIIANFAGMRARGSTRDFVIGEREGFPDFYRIAAFESPGLTAAPAVGEDTALRIAEKLGVHESADYTATRQRPRRFLEMTDEERSAAVEEDPAWGRMVCRCEWVTEAEIVAAMGSPIPALTIDAIKRRTRAGTGRCQGGFCTAPVAELIAAHTGADLTDIVKGRVGSTLTPYGLEEAHSW